MANALEGAKPYGLQEGAYRAGKRGANWDSWYTQQNLKGLTADQKRELANHWRRGHDEYIESKNTGGGGGW